MFWKSCSWKPPKSTLALSLKHSKDFHHNNNTFSQQDVVKILCHAQCFLFILAILAFLGIRPWAFVKHLEMIVIVIKWVKLNWNCTGQVKGSKSILDTVDMLILKTFKGIYNAPSVQGNTIPHVWMER